MSLASILYPAPTPEGLTAWFFDHYQHHLAIIGAVKASKGVILDLHLIYPVNQQDLDSWSGQHQLQHQDMAQALGTPSLDFGPLDVTDPAKLEGFMFAHFLEHQAAAQASGLPI